MQTSTCTASLPTASKPSLLVAASAIFTTLVLTLTPIGAAHAFDIFSSSKSITPSGQIKTERRNVSGFTGVALGMSGNVEIKQGATEGVTIETDDNILPLIQTVVENGTLQIRWEGKNNTGYRVDSHNHKINIVVNAINISRLAVGGSGVIRAAQVQTTNLSASIGGSGSVRIDKLTTEKLSGEIGGSGSLRVDALTAKKVSGDIGGSGNISLEGSADAFSGVVGGSGALRCGQLKANDVSISVAGSGSATVWAKDSLSVSIAGSGGVGYYGDAKVSIAKAGSGSVKRLGGEPRQ